MAHLGHGKVCPDVGVPDLGVQPRALEADTPLSHAVELPVRGQLEMKEPRRTAHPEALARHRAEQPRAIGVEQLELGAGPETQRHAARPRVATAAGFVMVWRR
jgi:hypothetical protein